MTGITYKQFNEILHSYGFQMREPEEDTRVYKHFGTGAQFITPVFGEDEEVLMRHYVGAKLVLDSFGIASPQEFERRFLKAG